MLLSSEQQQIRDTLREFARDELAPNAAAWDRDHTFPRDALRALGALGVLGIVVPETWGGAGLDYVSLAVALEEIAAGDGATSTIVSVQNSVVCGPINAFGSDAQKTRYLPSLAGGEQLGCFCLTEPQTGSDASAIATRADRRGDSYVLNGVKQFITTGANADVAIVFALTDKAAGKKGMSAFIVDVKTPGFVVARIEEKLGQRASDTAQIVFENCAVPAANLLGREGDGYRIALANLEGGRIGIAAQAVGMARAAFEAALGYARERQAFGKKLVQHQAVQWMIADSEIDLHASRMMVMHAAWKQERGDDIRHESSICKVFVAEAINRVIDRAVQICGALGVSTDTPLEHFYREARDFRIYDGPSEVHRMVIARNVLKS